jgi:glycosyltransferase involved in cell wall biosynthesis
MTHKSSRRLLYVGFYDCGTNAAESRSYWHSATNKMDYICQAVNSMGLDVLIVSPSRTTSRTAYRGKRLQLTEGTALKLFPTFPWGNRPQRAFSIAAGHILLFLYLVLNTRRNESVIVYHSLALMRSVRYAKKVRGFRMILEVEEIYQDVVLVNSFTRRCEIATFRDADAFIFSTGLLNDRLNVESRPHIVIHGTYHAEPDRDLSFCDNRTHVVYAGIIDSKKGATVAASVAAHLDGDYHIHIVGFGDKSDVEHLQQVIAEVSSATGSGLTYDGLFTGNEFLDFLQKCDIGLSTQVPGAAFNQTSFPSKILTYMTNGLAVVSIRIRSVQESKMADDIFFYDGQDPQDIARAIRGVRDSVRVDTRALIEKLNADCVEELHALLADSVPG